MSKIYGIKAILLSLLTSSLLLVLSCTPVGQTAIQDEAPAISVQEKAVVTNVSDECFNFDVLSAEDHGYVDSLLYSSLSNTGLHTFISDLKPMSDIVSFRWQIEGTEEDAHPALQFIDEFVRINHIAAAISCGPLKTILTPFRNIFDGERYVQMRVVRQDAFDQSFAAFPEFWSRWAFAEGTDPAIVVQVMEYEERLDRFRGYGLLYGYPEHAVDFFVDAAAHQAETGEFVERDFMQMPVVSGRTGMFVYAVPRGHEKNDADQDIYNRAQENVAFFLEHSQAWYDEYGRFDTSGFLRAVFEEKGW
ncbi:hypothetical protein CYPRO_1834 [Cyclonatronum proteinivorum]|uniref:Uncharacterized protein n=1 Tax=Cyclonatronum proteinivorum TaxID=1457365 RepID=A0A345UKT2_9BACT|nr:hypothetical protein [Cyclonatronum proteinivorum]AXJ01084.1 hypothetical protein CYPRO_1834 [Cyclonatronum proteinivorum]